MSRIRAWLGVLACALMLSQPYFALAALDPTATFNWINAANPIYGGIVGDAKQSTGCTTSGTTLTCNGQTFSSRDCHSGGNCTGPVDKIGWISYAGTSYNAFTFTIVNYLSLHSVTMSGTPTTALPVGGLFHVTQWGPTTNNNGGSVGTGYLLGDTVKPNCATGATCTTVATASPDSVATVNGIIPVTIPTLVSGGSGGTHNGSCTLTGTTGHAVSGNRLQILLTLNSSGAVDNTALAGAAYVNPQNSEYILYPDGTGNLSSVANEPMAAGSGCGALTGVALNFTGDFGAANLKAQDFTGFYTAITCAATSFYTMTAVTGSGTGATGNCLSIPAATTWGTNNHNSLVAAINAANNSSTTTPAHPTKIYVPSGAYVSTPLNTPLNGNGCIQGDSHLETVFLMQPNIGGDMLSFIDNGQGAQQGFGGTFLFASNGNTAVTQAGCLASNLGVIGDRSSSQFQAALTLYGGVAWFDMHDFYAMNVRGPCIRTGFDTSGTPNATTHEGWIHEIRCNEDGASTGLGDSFPQASVQIETLGQGEPPNGIHMDDFRIYHSHGQGFVIADCTPGGNNPHVNTLNNTHAEESGDDGADGIGDGLQLGDPDCIRKHFPTFAGNGNSPTTSFGSGVNGASSIQGQGNTINHARAGYANVHWVAAPSARDSDNSNLSGSFGGGAASLGGGVWVGSGQANKVTNTDWGSTDYPEQVVTETYWNGSGEVSGAIGSGIAFDDTGDGSAQNAAKNIEAAELPTGANPVQYSLYTSSPGHPLGIAWSQTQAITNNTSASNVNMIGTGVGSFGVGANYLQLGGKFNLMVSGTYSTAGSFVQGLALTFGANGSNGTFANFSVTPANSISSLGWQEESNCVVTSFALPTSATLFCTSWLYLQTTSTARSSYFTTSTVTGYDTTRTVPTGFNMTTTWSSFNSGDSLTADIVSLSVPN